MIFYYYYNAFNLYAILAVIHLDLGKLYFKHFSMPINIRTELNEFWILMKNIFKDFIVRMRSDLWEGRGGEFVSGWDTLYPHSCCMKPMCT